MGSESASIIHAPLLNSIYIEFLDSEGRITAKPPPRNARATERENSFARVLGERWFGYICLWTRGPPGDFEKDVTDRESSDLKDVSPADQGVAAMEAGPLWRTCQYRDAEDNTTS